MAAAQLEWKADNSAQLLAPLAARPASAGSQSLANSVASVDGEGGDGEAVAGEAASGAVDLSMLDGVELEPVYSQRLECDPADFFSATGSKATLMAKALQGVDDLPGARPV